MNKEQWKERIIKILDKLDEKDLKAIWFLVRWYG